MQKYNISFKGQNIFLGIDVHLKTWHVTALTETGFKFSFAQKADAKVLFDTLNKRFHDAKFHAAYEAGFSGFSTYYALKEVGIDTIVVNAADIPTTNKEHLLKTDAVDSAKIAKSLRNGELAAIYVKDRQYMDDTNMLRLRQRLIKDLGRQKNRTKHLLYTQGVKMSERFQNSGTHWSVSFMKWLTDDVVLLSEEKLTLLHLVKYIQDIRKQLLSIDRTMRKLSQSDKYKENFDLITTVPGIGTVLGMTILTELDNNPYRFDNEKKFASFMGLIPTCHDSGLKKVSGEMIHRGNKQLGPLIIEASWIAIRKDIGLAAYYSTCRQRMASQKAIIKVARKLACKTYQVLKTKKAYVLPEG